MSEKTVPLTMKVPKQVKEQLRLAAYKQRRSMTKIVLEAIVKLFGGGAK